MIKLTKINGTEFYLNPHLIERIDERVNSVITMDSQIQYIVNEKVDDIIDRIKEYRKTLSIGSQE